MSEPKKATLSIDQCPIHKFWAIAVNVDSHGTRLTPSKCCGRWREVRVWRMDAHHLREAALALENAAEEVDDD